MQAGGPDTAVHSRGADGMSSTAAVMGPAGVEASGPGCLPVTQPWWSEFVRQIRRRLDLSQRELACRAGLPKSTVGDVEAGHVDPGLGTLERLLEAAGLRLEVVDRTDRPADFHGDTSLPRDAAGRRLPPHLDARPREPGSYSEHSSRPSPAAGWTYHLDRSRRDAVRLADRYGTWGCGPPTPGCLDGEYVRQVWGDELVDGLLALAAPYLAEAGGPLPPSQRRTDALRRLFSREHPPAAHPPPAHPPPAHPPPGERPVPWAQPS